MSLNVTRIHDAFASLRSQMVGPSTFAVTQASSPLRELTFTD
jgi:hypothetical protein